ncbi:hypothetical protein ABE66_17220 [Cytobacillus firmus]|nr:hypothetical protein [Cytobacillus firmus]
MQDGARRGCRGHTLAFTAKNPAIEAGTLSKSFPLSGLLYSLLWMTLVTKKKRISCSCGLRNSLVRAYALTSFSILVASVPAPASTSVVSCETSSPQLLKG